MQSQQNQNFANSQVSTHQQNLSISNPNHQLSVTAQNNQSSKAIHEAIIDLYLQVKVRSNDEIDRFGQEQFKKERQRLLKFDSMTVLDYIKTSIEILMQIKEEGNVNNQGTQNNTSVNGGNRVGLDSVALNNLNLNRGGTALGKDLNDTGLSSTFKSNDLPPKEYEQQLQLYEAEIRNHIKVEQQLRLHIEVLNEKIEDFEKEKDQIRQQMTKESKETEKLLKEQFKKFLDQKQKEILKLNKDIQIYNTQLNQANHTNQQLQEKQIQLENQLQHFNQQQQPSDMIFRKFNAQNQVQKQSVQNFSEQEHQSQSPKREFPVQSGKTQINNGRIKMSIGNINDQSQIYSQNQKNSKSPYLNDCFQKLQISGQNTSQNSVNSGANSSKSAMSKISTQSMRKGSLDNEVNRSLGRSSNGSNNGERILKLKINKQKAQAAIQGLGVQNQQVQQENDQKVVSKIKKQGIQNASQIQQNMQNANPQQNHIVQSTQSRIQVQEPQNSSQRAVAAIYNAKAAENQSFNENSSHLTSVNSNATQIHNKHKKNKSQLSFTAASSETNGQIMQNPQQKNVMKFINNNFGPILHFHNNSGGIQGSDGSIKTNNESINDSQPIFQGNRLATKEQVKNLPLQHQNFIQGVTKSQNVSEIDYVYAVGNECLENDINGIEMSSSFNLKPNTEKINIGNRSLGKNNVSREQKMDQLQTCQSNLNASQSSVIFEHKNSLAEESVNALVNNSLSGQASALQQSIKKKQHMDVLVQDQKQVTQNRNVIKKTNYSRQGISGGKFDGSYQKISQDAQQRVSQRGERSGNRGGSDQIFQNIQQNIPHQVNKNSSADSRKNSLQNKSMNLTGGGTQNITQKNQVLNEEIQKKQMIQAKMQQAQIQSSISQQQNYMRAMQMNQLTGEPQIQNQQFQGSMNKSGISNQINQQNQQKRPMTQVHRSGGRTIQNRDQQSQNSVQVSQQKSYKNQDPNFAQLKQSHDFDQNNGFGFKGK